MASAKRFSIYPCSFVHAGGTLNLAQMQGFDSRPDATIKTVYVGGAVDPKANIAVMANPKVTFGTRDLTTLLGTLNPLTGLALAAGGATFRLQERDDGESIFLSTATHETHDVAKGHVILDGAVAQLTCHALYDGTNEPIVHNTGVDFSDGEPTPAFTSEFFMGPVYHNGSQLEGVTRWSVETGLVWMPSRVDGNVYPRQGFIARRTPKIKVTTLKVDTVASLNKVLRALSGTFALYLWKGANAGSRAGVASGVHLKVSAAAGAWRDESVAVTENEDGTATIEVLITGTLTWSITSTIP
jgi:hypothetical protein